jgi:hypothetical protein
VAGRQAGRQARKHGSSFLLQKQTEVAKPFAQRAVPLLQIAVVASNARASTICCNNGCCIVAGTADH